MSVSIGMHISYQKNLIWKDGYIHCTVGKSCSLFSWATLSLDLRRNRKKSTMLLLLFKSFFWIKKNREEQENSAIKLSRRMKMSGANVWQSHLCCWQRTDCFAATNFFFPRVRCEGALRLPKFLFMAILVVEFSRRGYKIEKIFYYKSTCPKKITKVWELV